MKKKEEAEGGYDDGLFYYFGDAAGQPQHIRVALRTDSLEVESCDVRLTTTEKSE